MAKPNQDKQWQIRCGATAGKILWRKYRSIGPNLFIQGYCSLSYSHDDLPEKFPIASHWILPISQPKISQTRKNNNVGGIKSPLTLASLPPPSRADPCCMPTRECVGMAAAFAIWSACRNLAKHLGWAEGWSPSVPAPPTEQWLQQHRQYLSSMFHDLHTDR